jgi:hypothetical protein
MFWHLLHQQLKQTSLQIAMWVDSNGQFMSVHTRIRQVYQTQQLRSKSWSWGKCELCAHEAKIPLWLYCLFSRDAYPYHETGQARHRYYSPYPWHVPSTRQHISKCRPRTDHTCGQPEWYPSFMTSPWWHDSLAWWLLCIVTRVLGLETRESNVLSVCVCSVTLPLRMTVTHFVRRCILHPWTCFTSYTCCHDTNTSTYHY